MNDIKETWYKWDYVCPDCDANIVMIAKSNGQGHDSYCLKCAGDLTLMSVVDATIYSPTKKEEQMDTVTLTTPYNPNLLVTYKKVAGTYANPEAPEYITDKVVDIEWALDQARKSNDINIAYNNKVNKLENILISSAENADEDMLELIKDIANTFDIALTKEIEVTGTMSFSARITVPLTEDYNLQDYADFVVTSYDTNSDVYDYSMDNVEKSY